jgi:enterochelin esterase family protein
VHEDRTVTFTFVAPHAQRVSVTGDWSWTEKKALLKDEDGSWSVTIGPMPPQIYTYSFVADEMRLSDPLNPVVITSPVWGNASLVEVPGGPPSPWADVKDVAHGTLHRHTYVSHATGALRQVVVYTPPGYEHGHDRFPVVYLLHGRGGDEGDWTTIGRAHRIADNLLAAGKMVPTLIVMPNLHAIQAVGSTIDIDWARNAALFEQDLLRDVMPMVEKSYRTRNDGMHRAVVGLSRGGAQAFTLAVAHPDRFAWMASMSGAVVPGLADNIDAADLNRRLRLVWMGCGKADDEWRPGNQKLEAALTQKGVRHVWRETEGAHTWLVWRENLVEVLGLLFR